MTEEEIKVDDKQFLEETFVDINRESVRGRIHDLPRWAE